jgi:hypothetical protein
MTRETNAESECQFISRMITRMRNGAMNAQDRAVMNSHVVDEAKPGNPAGDGFSSLVRFYDCQLMCNQYKTVDLGIANGTTVLFKKVHLMSDAELVPIQVYGYWIYSVDMKDVDCLEMDLRKSSGNCYPSDFSEGDVLVDFRKLNQDS